MAQHIFSSGAWLMACFLASFFFMGFTEAKMATNGAQGTGAILMGAREQASDLATVAYGKMSEYVESQQSLGHMVGVGAAGAAVLACTVYVASKCLDREPYLFNNGKLGKLEAQSVYNTKKCC